MREVINNQMEMYSKQLQEEASTETIITERYTIILILSCKNSYLRNKFDFWNIHGIMNTSGFLQSKLSPRQETQSIHDSMNRPKLNLLLIFTFNYKYPKYRNYL